MFLSDSSGSGQGFHAQIASISQLSKNKPSRGKSKSRHRKKLGFTRVSAKPTKGRNATRTTNKKHTSKKVTHLVTTAPALHKNITKPLINHENSVLTTNSKNPTSESTNKTASRNNNNNNISTRTSKEETLNRGHLKISMEIIDFKRNTSHPSNAAADPGFG